jgi:Predicted membrane protein
VLIFLRATTNLNKIDRNGEKKREFPNTYVIIFAIVVICAVATWFVPGGKYVNEEVVVNGVTENVVRFEQQKAVGQWWQVMQAFYNGFTKQSGIICFILVIGAAFWVVNKSKGIDAGIFSFLRFVKKLEQHRWLAKIGVNNIVIVLVMLLFSLFGAVFGMSEETIAFVIIIVPLAISMGYDSIVGVCMVYVAAHVGFAGAILNPFTIGIAQDLAGLPMFSGIEYRFICWVILNIITIAFVLYYASRIKKNPKKSVMYEADSYWRNHIETQKDGVVYYKNKASVVAGVIGILISIFFTIVYSSECYLTIGAEKYYTPWLMYVICGAFILLTFFSVKKSVHFLVLTFLGFTIIYLVIGVLGFSWYIGEISALFLTLGVLTGIAIGLSGNEIVKELMAGAKDILSAALVVGLAAGIVYILQEGRIIDTILHSMASGLDGAGETGIVGADVYNTNSYKFSYTIGER